MPAAAGRMPCEPGSACAGGVRFVRVVVAVVVVELVVVELVVARFLAAIGGAASVGGRSGGVGVTGGSVSLGEGLTFRGRRR